MPLASPTPKLALTADGAIATVALDNPARRNAVDLEMWQALPPLFAELGADPDVRAVVLRGRARSPSRREPTSRSSRPCGPTPQADGPTRRRTRPPSGLWRAAPSP